MSEARPKFWGGGGGASSSSESDSESSGNDVMATTLQPETKTKRWAEHTSSEDEAPTQKRVVKKQIDKRYDQLSEQIKTARNHVKIADYGSLITDYDTILKTQAKLDSTGAGQASDGPSPMFIKILRDLEEFIEKEHKDNQERKEKGERLSENKNKAFNTLRAKVKKGNRPYQEVIDYAKENPQEFESEQEEESGSDDDNESGEDGGADSSESSESNSDSDSDSDESDSNDSDSSSSGSSDSDSSSESSSGTGKGSWLTGSSSEDHVDEEAARERKMLRWLITPEKEAQMQAKAEKAKQSDKQQKERKPHRKADGASKESAKDGHRKTKEGKEDNDEELTLDMLIKKVSDLEMKGRGRKAFDRKAYMDKLNSLMKHAEKIGPLPQLFILTTMVSADFDMGGSAFASIKLEMWNEAIDKVNRMMPLLMDSYANEEDLTDKGDEEPASYMRLQQLFVSFLERLDDELYKALQFTVDVYGSEYQEILANSSRFLVLLKKALKFFEPTKQVQPLGAISMRLMEHLYYKPDLLNAAVFEAIQHNEPEGEKEDWEWPKDSHLFMAKLAKNVQEWRQPSKKLRASLCQAYHLALHNRFQEARDLLFLGKIQEQVIEENDASFHTQILYNRVIAQMGLCAFRLGKIQEAHSCLMDVCMHNKARELLAQGLSYSKSQDKTQEQEEKERLRQLPYHMHINLEVLESAHHICAMLLEVPNMAMQSIDPQKTKQFSRVLRRALELYDKQVFVGPPENPKEAAVSSAKALQKGDWQSAYEALENLKLWDHIDPCNPSAGAEVKEMIKREIKKEALRTYLFAYASIYDAFHLDQLVGMFDLPPGQVHSIVSKMMIKEELTAFWDESSKFVLVQHTEPTHLQRLCLQLADSVANAVENNDRLLQQRDGAHGYREQRSAQQPGRWDQAMDNRMGPRRFGGKGGPQPLFDDSKGRKGKGRGKTATSSGGAPRNRGWENARAAALRGPQRGFADIRNWGDLRSARA